MARINRAQRQKCLNLVLSCGQGEVRLTTIDSRIWSAEISWLAPQRHQTPRNSEKRTHAQS